MSSGTPVDPAAARAQLGALSDVILPDGVLSARQERLDALWRYFRTTTYDRRVVDWDGAQYVGHFDSERVASKAYVPPGFYEGGHMPLKLRRPTAPYHLGRLVVWRFTGLLFGASKHPLLEVTGDDDSEDYLTACVDAGALWACLVRARNYGGATGTAVFGFEFLDGRPVFTAHDPRWCSPLFADPETKELDALEIRYPYVDSVRDGKTGKWRPELFWYRRVIDRQTDTVWGRVPVGDGSEPAWAGWRHREVFHGLGEVPVEWVQNIPLDGDADGDPDAHGAFDLFHAVDALVAQANRGILSNSDPTVHVGTDRKLSELRKGSDNAIATEKGGTVEYLEISGTGPKAALELADRLEDRALKLCQCVIDEARSAVSKTATEVDRDYSSMWERADVLRGQYGPAVVRLVSKLDRAVRKYAVGITLPDGRTVAMEPTLPPREQSVTAADGSTQKVMQPRRLGPGGSISLKWPPYTKPTAREVGEAVKAAADAKEAELIDAEHATRYVAHHFEVDDPAGMLRRMAKEKEASRAREADELYAKMVAERSMAADGQKDDTGAPVSKVGVVRFTDGERDDGIATINEIRATKGFGPIANGELTVPQYKNLYPDLYANAVNIDKGENPDDPEPESTQTPPGRPGLKVPPRKPVPRPNGRPA